MTVRDAEVSAAWAATPPAGAVVVRVFARIRPLPVDIWGLNRGVGRDFLWIYPEEIAQLVAESGGLSPKVAPGTDAQLPAALIGRIARFHLVDDVRGTPMMWGVHDVEKADFHAHVVNQIGPIRTLAFAGDFALHRKHGTPIDRIPRPEQEYIGHIEGEIDLDYLSGRILRFRAFSDGSASGAGPGTPHPPDGHFRLLVAMTEADAGDSISRTVPPEAVATDRGDAAYHAAELPAR